jgi:alkanesulfonate monooxygenase SsuD/methylene tetrahydromethanopterin reductase-like flavin-dependent oxidoreductase (luciferase family)
MLIAMGFPFRFGLHFWELPVGDWRARVRRYEALGFSSITFTDHLVVPQWEPMSTLFLIGRAAEIRERLDEYRRRVGLTYFSLFEPGDEQVEHLAEHVVRPLVSAGQANG